MRARAWSFRPRGKATFSGPLNFARPVTQDGAIHRLTHILGYSDSAVQNMEFKPYQRKEKEVGPSIGCRNCICDVSEKDAKTMQLFYESLPSYVLEEFARELEEADCLAPLSKPRCWDCFLQALRDALDRVYHGWDW